MPASVKKQQDRRNVLERFRNDKELLAANHVTGEELAFLETVALFGNLESAEDVLFILKNIRAK